MEDVVQRLIQCIDEHIHDYQKQWQQQREIWHTIASANEKNEVAKALVALASSYGVESRIHAQPHNGIYGAWGEQAAPVVFIYVPVRQPGKKYLAILATWLVAIASYQKVLGTLPIQIHYILVNGDKASGQQLADLYSQAQPQTHNHLGCIWYSEESIRASPPLFALGCKGILDVELRARTATEPLASTHGAVVPNALWRLAWAINALKNAQEEILIPGFYDDVQPEADQQIAVLHTLPMCLQQYIQAQGIAQPLLGLQGFQFHYAHLLLPTCSISGLEEDGTAEEPRKLPAQAQVHVHFHLVSQQDPDDIYRKLQTYLQQQGFSDIGIQKNMARLPRQTPRHEPFIQAMQESCCRVYGAQNYVVPLSAGSYPIESIAPGKNIPIVFDLSTFNPYGEDSPEQTAAMTTQIKQIAVLLYKMQSLAKK